MSRDTTDIANQLLAENAGLRAKLVKLSGEVVRHNDMSLSFQKRAEAAEAKLAELEQTEITDRDRADKAEAQIAELAFAALTDKPATQPESEDYRNLKALYHAQEKRLFKLAQRIKGSAFDKYAHTTAQAIDVLEASLIDNTAPPVGDLAMLVRRLVHALKKSNPDSPLISQVSDYMQRSGYWQGKDCLRSVADDDTDDKRRAFIDSLQDDTAPQQYESLSTEAALKIGMERYGAAMKKLADNGDK